MKTFYRVMGAFFFFCMVPISILWVWFSQWWAQYLITDLILLAAGMITFAASLTPVEDKKKTDVLKNVNFHSN